MGIKAGRKAGNQHMSDVSQCLQRNRKAADVGLFSHLPVDTSRPAVHRLDPFVPYVGLIAGTEPGTLDELGASD